MHWVKAKVMHSARYGFFSSQSNRRGHAASIQPTSWFGGFHQRSNHESISAPGFVLISQPVFFFMRKGQRIQEEHHTSLISRWKKRIVFIRYFRIWSCTKKHWFLKQTNLTMYDCFRRRQSEIVEWCDARLQWNMNLDMLTKKCQNDPKYVLMVLNLWVLFLESSGKLIVVVVVVLFVVVVLVLKNFIKIPRIFRCFLPYRYSKGKWLHMFGSAKGNVFNSFTFIDWF